MSLLSQSGLGRLLRTMKITDYRATSRCEVWLYFHITVISMEKKILLTIDNDVLSRYNEYYFSVHTKAKKVPIANPYHESINVWMIMKRPKMNAVKGKWKAMMKWFIEEQGYANLLIEKCEITQRVFYPNNRRHDIDNSVPKFILDGLVEGKMIADDDCKHITKLILECSTDIEHPRTELEFTILETNDEK